MYSLSKDQITSEIRSDWIFVEQIKHVVPGYRPVQATLCSTNCETLIHFVKRSHWWHPITARPLKFQFKSICEDFSLCKAGGNTCKTNTPTAKGAKDGLVANPRQREAVVSSQLSGTLYQPCLPSSASMCRMSQLPSDRFSFRRHVCRPVDTGESFRIGSIACPLPATVNGLACHGGQLSQWSYCVK